MSKDKIKNADEFIKAMKDFELRDREPFSMTLEEYMKKLQEKDVPSKKHGGNIKIR
jgi:hypothetical protein